jgi:hypothetical protein
VLLQEDVEKPSATSVLDHGNLIIKIISNVIFTNLGANNNN